MKNNEFKSYKSTTKYWVGVVLLKGLFEFRILTQDNLYLMNEKHEIIAIEI